MKKYIRKNPEILMILYIPVYLVWFALAEHFIRDGYYVSYIPFDDMIPFVPAFAIPYVMWYPYLLAPIPILYKKDRPAYIRYGAYLIITLTVSLFVCCIFPNGQNLRPADTGEGLAGFIISALYTADTNTNVLPSMHAVTSLGTAMVYFYSRTLRRFALPSLVMAIAICAATVLIKQHSFLDVIWAFVLAAAAGVGVFVIPDMIKNGNNSRKGGVIKEPCEK